MTRESFDKAYCLIDRINKIKAIKEKLIREFPEWAYDKEAKEIGDEILQVLNDKIEINNNEFKLL